MGCKIQLIFYFFYSFVITFITKYVIKEVVNYLFTIYLFIVLTSIAIFTIPFIAT